MGRKVLTKDSRGKVIDSEPLEAETLYVVSLGKEYGYKEECYAWSPDGIGVYWYDTEEEFEDNHGTGHSGRYVDEITDF